MIFAHGPAGFVLTHFLKKYWNKSLSRKQIITVYLVGVIGGLFPDIDLFYYYLVTAKTSHHELLTHSFFIYFAVFILFFIIAFLIKNRFIWALNIVFFIGVFSHLAADSLGSGIMWFYPFSDFLFGLISFYFILNSWFTQWIFSINYSLETVILLLAFFIIINWLIKNKKAKLIIYIVFSLLGLASMFGFLYINQHLFKTTGGDIYYSDYDNDGIINKRDPDLDNDGIINLEDIDIDDDYILNTVEIKNLAENSEGVWYDVLEGGLLEIPLRMGLVTNADLIRRLYDNTGIFFKYEMKIDYQDNMLGYESPPRDKDFERSPVNWLIWLEHQDKLLPGDKKIQRYDILFFEDNYVALALGDKKILEANPEKRRVVQTSLKDIKNRQGEIKYIGRILP